MDSKTRGSTNNYCSWLQMYSSSRISESIEGLKPYIEECSKIINDPKTPREERKMVIDLRSEYYTAIAKGINAIERIKKQYYERTNE